MTSILHRVEPFLLSSDLFVQRFAMTLLNEGYLATPETLNIALKAIDGEGALPPKKVLTYISNYPLTAENFEGVLSRFALAEDEVKIFYPRLISKASTELLHKYRDAVAPLFQKEELEKLVQIKDMTTEDLMTAYNKNLEKLEAEQWYNHQLFTYGKRVVKELINRDVYNFEETRDVIREEASHDFFSYHGIYHIWIAGEMHWNSLVEEIAPLLTRDEDILLETINEVLVKIGGDQVVHAVEPLVANEKSAIFATGILSDIKSEQAEKALLKHFDTVEDLTIKTMIADGLCKQLSADAIPKVESLLATGYDKQVLDLEESLYGCCKILGVDHPDLQKWKEYLEAEERRFESIKDISPFVPKNTKKVGRNEPCPCGSGKKYKKCCGKN